MVFRCIRPLFVRWQLLASWQKAATAVVLFLGRPVDSLGSAKARCCGAALSFG